MTSPETRCFRSWTIILPFHNEEDFIQTAINSLACQTEALTLVLVDNGSTDRSVVRAIAACEAREVPFRLIFEPQPGKVAALSSGLKQVRTIFVATCDADTYYPPDYLFRARQLLEEGSAMAGAWFLPRSAGPVRRIFSKMHVAIAACIFSTQCLTGGAGQVFRRDQLVAAGGFDPSHWNLILEDHEVCHRVARVGSIGYDPGFWCDPGNRVRNRPKTRWGILERLVYHASASSFGDWFFYSFLKPRLLMRGLASAALREVTP